MGVTSNRLKAYEESGKYASIALDSLTTAPRYLAADITSRMLGTLPLSEQITKAKRLVKESNSNVEIYKKELLAIEDAISNTAVDNSFSDLSESDK